MIRKRKALFYIFVLTCIAFLAGCTGKKADDMNNTNANNQKNIQQNTNKETSSQNENKKNNQNESNQPEQAMGRYVETPCFTMDNRINNITILEDGTVAAINTITGELFSANDALETWETTPIKEMQYVISMGGCEITSVAMNKKGDIFFSYIPWNDIKENYSDIEKYIYLTKEGSKKELNLTVSKKGAWLLKAEFSDNGKLYALTNNGEFIEIDCNQESVEQLFEEEGYTDTFAVSENYIVTVSNRVGYIYNIETKELETKDSVWNEFLETTLRAVQTYQVAIDEKENAIYIACKAGVYRHVMNGSVVEQLVSGELSNLGSPSNSAKAFRLKEEGSFFVGYENGELDFYHYDANVPSVPNTQLRIYSLYESKTIQQAIVNYRKNNPDVFVKLEIGITGDDAVTKTDAIQRLNTSILAEDGPDLILLDGLPMSSYIEKGVLYDLSTVMKELEESESYLTNITHAYQRADGLYGVPAKFQIPVIIGDKEKMKEITTLQAFSKMLQDIRANHSSSETILGGYTPKEVLKYLEFACSAAWITEEGKADEEKLKEYLTFAKEIYELETENLSNDRITEYLKQLEFVKGMNNGLEHGIKALGMQLSSIMFGDQQMAVGFINDLEEYQTILATIRNDNTISYQIFDMQSQGNFIPKGIVGVNASSKNLETSLDFFKSLYTEKLQKMNVDEGLPVNKTVFSNLANGENVAEYSVGGSNKEGKIIGYELKIPTAEEMKSLLNVAESLSTPFLMESVVQDAVETFGEKVLTGEISVDDGVNAIVQKVNLYLKE
ncbi:ABC transporter substrate-binding protein [Anaerosporobacter sp.]|uniref:ABC transporter substrate-binding protein n=1 Tax=Anaerosporobacter sp. TaxID=1872529 RepID=UPI00286F64E0|nr:ABC transporter substrate-binding protein [Anaerosporobacter sp.]